jgi:predicted DCC family thiol-disulfide oxidoreductase YuxK
MAERKRHQVLYDDECWMCTFQMRLLTWLDWCDVARLVPASNPECLKLAPGLTREGLMEAIHCVTKEGRVLRGARALRFIGMRMPLLVPMALVLWVPGVIWVAEKVYDCVSRNRYLLSRVFGCKGACDLLPKREREGEMTAKAAKK